MSDRLNELKRQRALVQEQLAWFDREIANETGRTPAAAPSPAAVPVAVAPANVAALDAAAARAADDIIARYQKGPSTVAGDARKGCWLWFAFALGMFAIGIVALYVIYGATK